MHAIIDLLVCQSGSNPLSLLPTSALYLECSLVLPETHQASFALTTDGEPKAKRELDRRFISRKLESCCPELGEARQKQPQQFNF